MKSLWIFHAIGDVQYYGQRPWTLTIIPTSRVCPYWKWNYYSYIYVYFFLIIFVFSFFRLMELAENGQQQQEEQQ